MRSAAVSDAQTVNVPEIELKKVAARARREPRTCQQQRAGADHHDRGPSARASRTGRARTGARTRLGTSALQPVQLAASGPGPRSRIAFESRRSTQGRSCGSLSKLAHGVEKGSEPRKTVLNSCAAFHCGHFVRRRITDFTCVSRRRSSVSRRAPLRSGCSGDRPSLFFCCLGGSSTLIIAVVSRKGGVGKSTTVVNVGAALAEAGRRVLVVGPRPPGLCLALSRRSKGAAGSQHC